MRKTFRAFTAIATPAGDTPADDEGERLFGVRGWALRKSRGLPNFDQIVAEGEVNGGKAVFDTCGHWIERVEFRDGGDAEPITLELSEEILPASEDGLVTVALP